MREDYGSTCLCKNDKNRIDKINDNHNIVYEKSGSYYKRKSGLSCLILGIVSQLLWFFPIIGLLISIIGLITSIYGLIHNERNSKLVVGLILNIVSINLSLILLFI